jgi:hypothetical protein
MRFNYSAHKIDINRLYSWHLSPHGVEGPVAQAFAGSNPVSRITDIDFLNESLRSVTGLHYIPPEVKWYEEAVGDRLEERHFRRF